MCLSTDPKCFWTSPKIFEIDQIVKKSVVKSCVRVQSKTIPRQIQNDLGPDEGQSNSCVMYALFFILMCSTLIKFDFNQYCLSYKVLHLVFVGLCFVL